MAYIEFNNISKEYVTGENVIKALDEASFIVEKGELAVILGSSGAGKTTLLQIIGTLDKADSGQILINNRDVTKLSDNKLSEFRNKEIGFVFQFHHLLAEFTALENVMLPALIGKQNNKETEERAKELLNIMHLYDRANHKPSQLSGGEQQRVAVARALINSPSIILADEPSGNLDSRNAKELHEYFFKLRETYKQTFLIVTHSEELAKMSDRMIEMQDGKII